MPDGLFQCQTTLNLMENEGVDNMGVGVGDIFTRIVGPIFCGKMGVK